MKNSNHPIREADIRSEALSIEYLALVRRDAERLAARRTEFEDVACGFCGTNRLEFSFEKHGFPYAVCAECQSLYSSPRPTRAQLQEYLDTSEAVDFWSTHFYPQTAAARRVQVSRPQAARLSALADQHGLPTDAVCVDVGAGYGLFLQEVRATGRFGRLIAVEPDPRLAAICRAEGFTVVQRSAEQLGEDDVVADIATAFEVLEHVFDPLTFLQSAGRAVRPGGLLLFTTLAATGFDIQVLWEHSRSISPPQHLNFPSVEGTRRLIARAGLEVVDIETPGRLDVEIVKNRLAVHPTWPVPRFARQIAAASERTRDDFQRFLREHQLSSHLMGVARRPG